jgi:hypothetical protein
MAFDKTKQYKPGEKCEQSGIYKVTHDRNHHEEHEVTVVFGEPFPPCNHCGQHPRFLIVRAAIHVKNHDEFK